MQKIRSYKDLIVWQKGYALVRAVYIATEKLPQSEVYALQSQTRRAAISIVSNIAEGTQRKTRKDYAHFLHMAYGSAAELETQLFLCRDLYMSEIEGSLSLLDEVSRMIRAIINKLEPRN